MKMKTTKIIPNYHNRIINAKCNLWHITLMQALLFVFTSNITTASPKLLDEYESTKNITNGYYSYYLLYTNPTTGAPQNNISALNGKLRINPGLISTAAHLWNKGEKLAYVKDKVSIQISSMTSPAAAGLYICGDLNNPNGGEEIRVYRYSQWIFKGPWGDAIMNGIPGETFAFPINLEITVLAINEHGLSLRANLFGTGFYPIEKDFLFNNFSAYFGPVAYQRFGGFQQFDNLTYTPNIYRRWSLIAGLGEGINDGKNDDPNNDGIPNFAHFAFGNSPVASGINTLSGYTTKQTHPMPFTFIIPVRKSTQLDGSGPIIGNSYEGIQYIIEGSTDMVSNWNSRIFESDLPNIEGLPDLQDVDGDGFPDWEYRAFRFSNDIADQPHGFIRAKILVPE